MPASTFRSALESFSHGTDFHAGSTIAACLPPSSLRRHIKAASFLNTEQSSAPEVDSRLSRQGTRDKESLASIGVKVEPNKLSRSHSMVSTMFTEEAAPSASAEYDATLADPQTKCNNGEPLHRGKKYGFDLQLARFPEAEREKINEVWKQEVKRFNYKDAEELPVWDSYACNTRDCQNNAAMYEAANIGFTAKIIRQLEEQFADVLSTPADAKAVKVARDLGCQVGYLSDQLASLKHAGKFRSLSASQDMIDVLDSNIVGNAKHNEQWVGNMLGKPPKGEYWTLSKKVKGKTLQEQISENLPEDKRNDFYSETDGLLTSQGGLNPDNSVEKFIGGLSREVETLIGLAAKK